MKDLGDMSAATIEQLCAELNAWRAKVAQQEERVAQLEAQVARLNAEPQDSRWAFWLSAHDASVRLGVTMATLATWRREGQIPAWAWNGINTRCYKYSERWVVQQKTHEMRTRILTRA